MWLYGQPISSDFIGIYNVYIDKSNGQLEDRHLYEGPMQANVENKTDRCTLKITKNNL